MRKGDSDKNTDRYKLVLFVVGAPLGVGLSLVIKLKKIMSKVIGSISCSWALLLSWAPHLE